MKKLIVFLLIASFLIFIPMNILAAEKVFKLGTNTAPSDSANLAERKFAEILKEKSNGRLEVKVYDSAKLGDHLETLEGLRNGTIEMTMTSLGYMAGYEKAFGVFDLPYIFSDYDHMFRFLDGEGGEFIDSMLEKYGFKVLGYFYFGVRETANKTRPIYKPEDMNGIKIRVQESKASIQGLGAMGATPTPVPWSELYMALQQNVVDGMENSTALIYSSKVYELLPYLSLTNHLYYPAIILISKQIWDNLSSEDQKLIMEAQDEAVAWQREYALDEELKMIEVLEEKGMKVNEADVPAFIEAVKPLKKKFEEELGENARKLIEIIDSLR